MMLPTIALASVLVAATFTSVNAIDCLKHVSGGVCLQGAIDCHNQVGLLKVQNGVCAPGQTCCAAKTCVEKDIDGAVCKPAGPPPQGGANRDCGSTHYWNNAGGCTRKEQCCAPKSQSGGI